jgi:hypothetical protein
VSNFSMNFRDRTLAESSNLPFIYDSRRFPTLTTRHSAWLPRSASVRPIPESTSQDGFSRVEWVECLDAGIAMVLR